MPPFSYRILGSSLFEFPALVTIWIPFGVMYGFEFVHPCIYAIDRPRPVVCISPAKMYRFLPVSTPLCQLDLRFKPLCCGAGWSAQQIGGTWETFKCVQLLMVIPHFRHLQKLGVGLITPKSAIQYLDVYNDRITASSPSRSLQNIS